MPSLSIKRYVVIRLKPRWISSKPYVNFKRSTRKHYLSLKPIWNEAYFIGKWSLFQWRMKLLSTANETTFNSQWSYFQQPMKLASISNGASFNLKRSLFVLQYKQNRDGYPQNREGCVIDKSPFWGISHACYFFRNQHLIRLFLENRDGW